MSKRSRIFNSVKNFLKTRFRRDKDEGGEPAEEVEQDQQELKIQHYNKANLPYEHDWKELKTFMILYQ